MDAFSCPTPHLFDQLSRLSDGDHSVFVRTDAQAFLEYHRGGKSSVFTSHVAALMPNVVIKLHTPLVPSIISSVQPQQGRPVQRDPHTRLYVADGLTDIIGLVKDHKAATLREDATLVSWSNNSLHEALTSLLAVYKDLHALIAKYDPARAVDPAPFLGDSLVESSMGMDCFDQFIHNYESSTSVGDKPQDFSTFFPGARNTLPPLGTLESVNSIDGLFSSSFRAPYVSSRSTSGMQSPMLGDSPSTYMSSSISRLCIDNTPLSSASMFSPAMSFTFSSPSASTSSVSDGTLSTPMTIAPSVLSSPNSWESTPLMESPSLPVILETPLEENFDEESASHFLNGPQLPDSQPMISPVLPPSPRDRHAPISVANSPKRKRPSPAKAAPAAPKSPSKARTPAAEKSRSRRSPPVTSPKASKASASRPKKALAAPKKAKVAPVPPPAPRRGVCPLPGRVVKSSRRSISASSSPAPEVAPNTAVSTRPFLHVSDSLESDEESDHEHTYEDRESDCDSESDYEADRSSDDDEDDFRPYKRTRSSSRPIVSALDDSSRTCRKARSQKINAAMGVGSRKGSSTRWRKGAKKEKEPRSLCMYFDVCGKDFSRNSDMMRHAHCSCPGNPKKRGHSKCPLCDFVASRHDAALRHRGSENCRQRVKAKLERLARGEEDEEGDAADASMDEQSEAEAVADAATDEEREVEEAVEAAEAEAGEQ
ncbi:hypothetical protein OH76DRAFT_188860 [Lentinus brumalis]|uniref:DUF7928 domain-containing protein n=1 Tax=Lentinus brumalis TaxID=2498619 RepID=A0A371CMZ4_9APHY|nr:hypothetical protein OH76DRAFT_188860 [Polyporus brumalis]